MKMRRWGWGLLAVASFVLVSVLAAQPAFAQEPPAQTSSAQSAQAGTEPASAEPAKKHEPKSIGGELAEETREATGAEEEEHSDLKHSSMVKLLAKDRTERASGASRSAHSEFCHHCSASCSGPAVSTCRAYSAAATAAIQQALEEARAASQDANRRLADIESRLRQLDVEIGQMQATAEKEGQRRGRPDPESGRRAMSAKS